MAMISVRARSAAVWMCVAAVAGGCTRSQYRQRADGEVADIVAERQNDPSWRLPDRPVYADPASRLADPAKPDCGPLPPDDRSARRFTMECAFKFKGPWRKQPRGELAQVENPGWEATLPRTESGAVSLSRTSALELALLHSREYQAAVEEVYRAALALTQERFRYQLNFVGGIRTAFEHFGHSGPPTETNTLSIDSAFGVKRTLAAGGQLAADFANALVFEYAGDNLTASTSSLVVTLAQPLLRGYGEHIQLESLTLAERRVLYAVRDFARFRRAFFVETAGSGGVLGLVAQRQNLRNLETNLDSLRRNLEEHRELQKTGFVAPIQVDQVLQRYQQGRLLFLTATAGLETNLDAYKAQLGLPPNLKAELDETALAGFELNDPKLRSLISANDARLLVVLQDEKPTTKETLGSLATELAGAYEELGKFRDGVEKQFTEWRGRLEGKERDAEIGDRAAERDHQRGVAKRLESILAELDSLTKRDREFLQKLHTDSVGTQQVKREWRLRAVKALRDRANDLYVVQAQVRVYLIELPEVRLDETQALEIATSRRHDLMNAKARVSDAYRAVEIAGNALQGDLNVRYDAILGTDPNHDGIFRFDTSASRHRLALQFDGPLNRRAERNNYRSAQLAYQQARRDYMAVEDRVKSDARRHLRNLEAGRLQFEISRRQVETAARQVDESQLNLRNARTTDSSVTQDLLGALQSLLDARNGLINTWVDYETNRMNLFRDLEVLEVDAQGVWINERETFGSRAGDAGSPSSGAGNTADNHDAGSGHRTIPRAGVPDKPQPAGP